MIKYGTHIQSGMLLAPVEQLGLTPPTIRFIFKHYFHDKSYPSLEMEIIEANENTQLVECYFCQGGYEVSYTYPHFTVSAGVLSLRSIYHTCDKCQVIAKLNEKNKNIIIKRIDFIIEQIKSLGEGFYLGRRGGEELYMDAMDKKNEYAKRGWIWDLTFLKRRGMSMQSIIESLPNADIPKGVYPPLLFSGFSSVKEFCDSHLE